MGLDKKSHTVYDKSNDIGYLLGDDWIIPTEC